MARVRGHLSPGTAEARPWDAPCPFPEDIAYLLYVLLTGCRWCDVPCGPQWASKSATHRWWQRWQADGTLAARQARILEIAEERGMMRWEYGVTAASIGKFTVAGMLKKYSF